MNDQPYPASPPPVPEPTPPPAAPIEPDNQSSSGLSRVLSGLYSALKVLLNWFIIPLGIVLILHNFVFQAFHVVGNSMLPNFQNEDYLIVSKLDSTFAKVKDLDNRDKAYIPKRGEVIVFRYPRDPKLVFVKRVIGIPGDRILIKDNKITLFTPDKPDGYDPDTGYERADTTTLGNVETTVEPGTVFVVGDNRAPNGSFDSRDWGALPSEFIIGKAVVRLLPLDKFKFIANPVKS
jgi:signal peptidase I